MDPKSGSNSPEVRRLWLSYPNNPVRNSQGVVAYRTRKLEIWSSVLDPIIQDNSTKGVAGSVIPASVNLLSKEEYLIVELSQTSKHDDGAFQLIGKLNGHQVAKGDKCYLGQENCVRLIAKHPSVPWGYAGDIQWTLHRTTKGHMSQVRELNATRIEIYGLSSLPNFFKVRGVPVKFLRYIALPEPKADYQRWVATTCMTDFWFRYDTDRGAARFAERSRGGIYRLDYWLATMFKRLTVNCYDQAGIVQLALALQKSGSSVEWTLAKPFGFINQTELVGVGLTNNPFCEAEFARRCVEVDDPKRTYFGNHAFILSDYHVLDATCGPHTGTETFPTYLTNAVDRDTTDRTINRATESIRCDGVTGIDSSQGREDIGAEQDRNIEEAMLKRISQNSTSGQLSFSNADLAGLGRRLTDHFPSFHLMHEFTEIGSLGGEISCVFRVLDPHQDVDTTVTLKARICKNNQAARQAMLRHLETYQRPLTDFFPQQIPVDATEPRLVGLRSDIAVEWVFGDVFVILDADNESTFDIQEVDRFIKEYIATSCTDQSSEKLIPDISSIHFPHEAVEVGTEFAIKLSGNDIGALEASTEKGRTLLLSKDQNTKECRFLALTPGEDEIILYAAHPQALRTVCQRVKVTFQGSNELDG